VTGHAPRARRRHAPIVAVLLVAVLILVGAAVLAIHYVGGLFGQNADYSGSGYGSVTVHVDAGDTQTAIGQTLTDDGVTASVGAYTQAAAANPQADRIQPGYYRLHHHMSAASAVSLLLSKTSLVQTSVVIPEGFTADAIVQRIAADTTISPASLHAALRNPSALGLPAAAKGRVEGFLFPATYDFAPGTTATQALAAMVTRWKQEAATLDLPRAAHRVGLTPYQVVTLASIVQREGRLNQDFPKIAQVFLNRLHQGMPLGSNATLYYVLGPDHGPLTASDLASNSPYNTEHRAGLPPTPINSPGEAALQAVLHPTKGPWLYFVTIDQAGHTGFATSYSGFQRLQAEAKANGVS
jgi:UPF0755 protein